MKILCGTCKRWICEPTDKFVLGGPYNGTMFSCPHKMMRKFMFKSSTAVVRGKLFCPVCKRPILKKNGDLLTEHGLIRPGQTTVDTSFSVLHQDGMAVGKLQRVEYSKELPTEANAAEQLRQIAAELTEDMENLVCPKCGKSYKNSEKGKFWYDKHIGECDGNI